MVDKDYKALAEQYNTKDYNALADQYNQIDSSGEEKSPISKLESSIRGGAQGLTYGNADEITAGIQHPIEGALQIAKLLGADVSDSDTADYRKERDESRAAYDAAQKQNPMSYLSGEFAGGILPAVAGTALSGGLGAPAAIGQTATALSTLQKLKAAAGAAGVIGAASGLGNSTEDTGLGVAKDIGIGTGTGLLTGAALHGAGQLVGSAAEKLAPGLKSKAELMAAKAFGANKADFKNIDKMKAMGRTAMDEGVITPTSDTATMLQKVQGLMNKYGKARNDVYNQIDKAGTSTFNPSEAAMKVESKITGNLNPAYDDTQEAIKRLEPALSNILSRGDSTISMGEAQKLVESLGNKAKFDATRSSEANDMAKQVYNTVREALNDSVQTGTNNVNLKNIVQEANKKMSSGYKMQDLLNRKLAGEIGNKAAVTPSSAEVMAAAMHPTIALGEYAGRQAFNLAGGAGAFQRTAALAADKAADIMSGKTGIADAVLNKTQPFINSVAAKYGPDAFLTKALQKIHANPADMAKKSMLNVLLQSGYKPHLESLHKDMQDQDEQNSSGAANGSETSEN